MGPSSRACIWAGVLLSSATAATPDQYRSVRLSSPLPPSVTGDILEVQIAPDGSRAVYRGQQDEHGVTEIYSVPIDGGAPIQLNPPLVGGGDVAAFAIGGERVVYLADQQVDGVLAFFSVPIDGSAPAIELYVPTPADVDDVVRMEVSSDGAALAVTVRMGGVVDELYLVPTDGSTLAMRLATITDSFRFTPDGSRVVLSGRISPQQRGIFSIRSDGGDGPIQLEESQFFDLPFDISPDSSRVVYRRTNGRLASIPIRGGAWVGLMGPTTETVSAFAYAPVGNRVAYRLTSGRLCSVPDDRSTPVVQLTDRSITAFGFSPDGTQLAFSTIQPEWEIDELFGVPSDGSAPAVLLASTPYLGDFRIGAGGTRVVFLAAGVSSTWYELFSAPMNGSLAPVRLHPPALVGQRVTSFQLGLVNQRVAYRADHRASGRFELFTARIDGVGLPFVLNDALAEGGDVQEGSQSSEHFQVDPDGTRVLYRADQDEAGVFELFATSGAHPTARLNAPLTAEAVVSDVIDFQLSPDDDQALYEASSVGAFLVPTAAGHEALPLEEIDGGRIEFIDGGSRVVFLRADELYVWTLVGSQAPTLLFDGVASWLWTLSPDERFLVLVTKAHPYELFSVPLDGSGPPVRLNGPLVAGGEVGDGQPFTLAEAFGISSDSHRVVYLADQETNAVWELFGVPIDGSSPAVQLSAEPIGPGYVRRFRLDPTGRRVAFMADTSLYGREDLFVVPIEGGSAPVRLNATDGPLRVMDAHFTPDGNRVVFRVASDGAPRGIFSASTSGGSAPVRLFANDGSFGITPDGTRVVASQPDLFVRAIDASSPALQLSTGISNIWADWRFGLEGDWLVFRRPNTLYVVPLDASAPSTRITPSGFQHEGDGLGASAFEISPDGRTVVHRASNSAGARLFASPVDGSSPAVVVNGSMAPGGEVASDFEIDGSGRVYYLADQEIDGRTELFMSVRTEHNAAQSSAPGQTVVQPR